MLHRLYGFIGVVGAWRSECDVEGVTVEVTLHGVNPLTESEVGKCRVAFLNHGDLEEPPELGGVDVVFTDSLRYAPFAGRNGMIHFLENISEFYVPDDLDNIMQTKTELLSVLMPPNNSWDETAQMVYSQAESMMPDHIYIDDGSLETHAKAFSKYRFSLIVDSATNMISLPFIRSLSFHTIAAFNGFVEVGAMVFNGIADFETTPFSLPGTLDTIKKHNEQLGALWHYQRILQDQLQYRYNRPFEERLFSQACSLCRLRRDAILHRDEILEHGPDAVATVEAPPSPPLVYIGIYSARRNFAKRQVIRETWGRLFLEEYGFHYTFFLGAASPGATQDEIRMRREVDKHRDIVFLDIGEGYRMNSRKGLLFLEWIALRVEAQFLLKIDDDVYFRPAPLLAQLERKPPTQYVWGYWDYISPVPREEGHYFHNTEEDFPFDVFAPYPRGVVRVLSMDVVRLLAEASREGRLRMIYGDDPCIGVHLRQLVFDPEEPLPSLTLDDFDNKVVAMEPSCHPNLWSKMSNRTWAIHHVSPEQIQCMWKKDVEGGYYTETDAGVSHNGSVALNDFPSLCECATDPSFDERTDLDQLRSETNRILYDEGENELLPKEADA